MFICQESFSLYGVYLPKVFFCFLAYCTFAIYKYISVVSSYLLIAALSALL